MIELFQAEWCPYSALVRESLTELGVDYVVRQVPPYPPEREALRELSGQDSIPVVRLEDGTVLSGDSFDIVEELRRRLDPWEHAEGHRAQAEAHGTPTA